MTTNVPLLCERQSKIDSHTEGTVPLPALTNKGELNQEILPGLKMVLQMSSILL